MTFWTVSRKSGPVEIPKPVHILFAKVLLANDTPEMFLKNKAMVEFAQGKGGSILRKKKKNAQLKFANSKYL